MNELSAENIGKHVIAVSWGAPGAIIGLCDAAGRPADEGQATDYMIQLDQPLSGVFGTINRNRLAVTLGNEEMIGEHGEYGSIIPLPVYFVTADPSELLDAPIDNETEDFLISEDLDHEEQECEESDEPEEIEVRVYETANC